MRGARLAPPSSLERERPGGAPDAAIGDLAPSAIVEQLEQMMEVTSSTCRVQAIFGEPTKLVSDEVPKVERLRLSNLRSAERLTPARASARPQAPRHTLRGRRAPRPPGAAA